MHLAALDQMRRQMDSSFNGFGWVRPVAAPNHGLVDTGDAFVFRALVPGVSQGDLEVSFADGTLTIKGSRTVEAPDGFSAQRQERRSYSIERTFELPTAIEPEGIVAELNDGVLTVGVPKAAEARPRTIEIKVN